MSKQTRLGRFKLYYEATEFKLPNHLRIKPTKKGKRNVKKI